MRISQAEMREFAPHALPEYVDALVAGEAAFSRAGITTPLRMAHFLAQTAHETGGYTILRENTSWTPEQMCLIWPKRFYTKLDPRIRACKGDEQALANLAYGGDFGKLLGNVDADDGWAYRGGGFLQLTGRKAYKAVSAELGTDLEASPELIEDGEISLGAALWVWAKSDLNRFADRNYGRAVGNAINRGSPYRKEDPVGFQSRQKWFERAWRLIGDGRLPATDELALGAYGPKVAQLQTRLRELGYGVGDSDQVFGPVLARAVAAFKLDTGQTLELAEIVGPATWNALDAAEPIVVSQERATATERELAAKGSSEVITGRQQKAVGRVVAGLGGLEVTRQTGVLEVVTGPLSSVSALKSTLVPALDAVAWGLKHWLWVVLIVTGIWYWQKGHQIVLARLKAHRLGLNLFR